MSASRYRLLRVAVLGWFLLLAAGCGNAGRFGAPGLGPKGDGVTSKPLSEKLGPTSAAARQLEVSPEDALKSSAALVKRARAASRELQRISERVAISPGLEVAAAELPERRAALAKRVAVATDGIRHSRRGAWVRDIRYSFVEDKKQIDALQAKVEEVSVLEEANHQRVHELLAFWRRVQELAAASEVPAEIREQIAGVVKDGERAELALDRPESVVISLQSTLAEMRDLSDSVLRAADRDGPDLLNDAADRDFSLWEALRGLGSQEDPIGVAKGTSRRMLEAATVFLNRSKHEIVAHIVFLVAILIVLLSLRANKDKWVGEEREGNVARRVIEHPFATSLLVSVVVSGLFYDATPTAVLLGVYVLGMAPALVLLPRLLEPGLRRFGYRLGGFVLLDAVRMFLIDIVFLERIVLTLELVAAALLLGTTLRRRSWQDSPFVGRWMEFYRAVAWVWLVGASLAAGAAVFGYGGVTEILGSGVLVSMYMSLILTAAFEAVGGTVWVVTQSALVQRLNFIRLYRSSVLAFVSRALGWIAVLVWAYASLDSMTLVGPVRRMLWGLLTASLTVGTLNVSLGDLLILVLGVLLAIYSARLIRFLLEEDVLPRLEFSEGNRQVTSSSIYYGVIFLGFFFTLAAVGIELSKLTVLAGALGVGIGFGLQNVVQNFVSGLILMFGGPLKVRDKIQIGDLMGEVRTIGFRASTVRTAQGAEVIVPNSKLISDQVINWTLSDQKRRVDIDIGVEYGSDPERVLAILREVARAHPKVFAEPQADALFIRHAPSSLDFQVLAWSTFDDHGSVRSELTTAINRRLTDEKIGLPFQQRDLNIRSISPEASEALRGLTARPEQPAKERPAKS